MKYQNDLIVIGAGSGGLVVASGAAALGARVTLIEKEKMGGDCLNSGCVPSKSFLKGAHLAKDMEDASQFGIHSTIESIEIGELMHRVHGVIDQIAPHDSIERYEGLGVSVVTGAAKIKSKHEVVVDGKTLTAKNIVFSTGSKPYIPKIKGLDQVSYLTNLNIFEMDHTPKHLIVLGAGPIGLELGQGFRHLGVEVTMIDQNKSLFTKDDLEVGPLMEKVLVKDGVQLLLNSKIIEIIKENEEIKVIVEKDNNKIEIIGDELLVALGRVPNTQGLGLEEIGVKLNARGYIQTNKKLQTHVKNIYACGDVVGPYQFTHMAGYQAGLVIRNAIFHLGAKVNYYNVPWTTYTKPEVAHIGYTEQTAKELNLFKKAIHVPLESNDRAKAENDVTGFLKLIVGKKGTLIGATLVGEKAGEMIPIASLAIQQKLKPSVFMNIIFSYPTESEIFKTASLQLLRDSFKPWKANLLKKILFKK